MRKQTDTPSVHCHVLSDWPGRSPATKEIRAFVRCRNERLRLPAFLKYYRRLGVDRFFVIDNDSSDGTIGYLAGEPDVRVFRTSGRFSESRDGTDWLNALLAEFGVGCWCVTADVDELLTYPGSEEASLHELTAYLDRQGHDALSCLLLDLYPSGPLNECVYQPGDDFLRAAPYFDAAPYTRTPLGHCPGVLIRGGMRERVFYPEFRLRGIASKIFDAVLYRVALRTPLLRNLSWVRAQRRPSPPCLTKVPLVRWNKTSRYLHSTHWISRKTIAPETGALLHFKFMNDFHTRALEEVARNEHYDASTEYRRYSARLEQDPDLTLMYEGSVRFAGTSQLVQLGLMQDTQAWAKSRACAHEPLLADRRPTL
jgi:hypothetical protein